MLLLVLLLTSVPFISCLNVLIWSPTVGQSHVRFLGNIADILADDGHNVTIVSPVLDLDVRAHTHNPAVLHLSYHSKYMRPNEDDDFSKLSIKGTSLWDAETLEGRSCTTQDMALFVELLKNIYRGILEDEEFLSRLRNSRFDVALHELYEPFSVGIFELIGVTKTVALSAFGVSLYVPEITGVPANPSFVPGAFSTYSDSMTFWERLNNFIYEFELDVRYRIWERQLWLHFNEVYPGFPTFRELLKRQVGVVLLNINEYTETPRPTANIVRYIGGIAIHPPKPLSQVDKRLDAILNERSTNVFLSFGTISQSKDLPLILKKDIISAFSAFPNTTFVWKYEDENDIHLFKNHTNIHTMKWIPQSDLLGDKRLSAFITHAGMNSVLEATFSGKPMVVVPLFGDQYLNAKNMERRGTAVMIDKRDLNKDTLTAAIRDVLSPNATYAHKAATVARSLVGRVAAARADLLYWVKLVAEEGQMDHLMMRARDLSFIQYHCLDIIAYLLAQFIVTLIFVFFVVRLLIRRVSIVFKKRKTE
ncbi:hypothetical protein V3C99_012939 [Haemonchus contortus]